MVPIIEMQRGGNVVQFAVRQVAQGELFPENVIPNHVHADAVRRLPFGRILKFFGGRLHRGQMDQGAARSTVGNVLKRMIFSSEGATV